MNKLTVLLGLCLLLPAPAGLAQVSDAEIGALRAQVEALTRRLDELEKQNRAMEQALHAPHATASGENTALPASVEERIDQAVAEQVVERMAAVSWAERLRWKGDFRYRYENIDIEGEDGRNRNRIRARTSLEATMSPNLKVGFGLATGGDDPVSANVTLGGGGSRKSIDLDLAYFDWSGLENTHVLGGKFSNFLVRPEGTGLIWDGDWRPEGLGIKWDNGTFFAQGLGTWLQGDSRAGTEFAYIAQGGVKLDLAGGRLMFGGGYSEFNIAGATPLYGDPEDFYGNSYVIDPVSGDRVFAYDYQLVEAFAEYAVDLAGKPFSLFADYVLNTDADDNDTGYLFGAKFGDARNKGSWDASLFYEKLEADATVGLLTDSDFGNGGTDAKGFSFQGNYALQDNWYFTLTYFLNQIDIASRDPRDFDRVQLDLNFKYK